MSALLVTPPSVLAVSLDAAREKIRQTTGDLDDQLTLSIQGLVADVESRTGHCFMEQSWRVTLNAFPASVCGAEPAVALPHPALAVQSLSYVDEAGHSQLLGGGDYELVVETYRSIVVPAAGADWPQTAARPRAVTIECTAGYGNTPDKTPPVARQYILARLELEYCPSVNPPAPEHLERLLDSLIVYE